MELVGYILSGPDGEVQRWGGTRGQVPGVPNPLMLPGDVHVHAPSIGVDYDGYSLVEWYLEDVDPPPPSTPTLCCLGVASVSGGELTGLDTATGIAFGFLVDVDRMWVFFSEPMASLAYGWNVSATSGTAKVTDRQLDYFEVLVEGAVEPYDVSIQIYRVT